MISNIILNCAQHLWGVLWSSNKTLVQACYYCLQIMLPGLVFMRKPQFSHESIHLHLLVAPLYDKALLMCMVIV